MKKWNLDGAHSEVGFSVRHMMISKVKGNFTDFEATIEADENNLEGANIDFKIDVASITTHNADRDAHLKSADFFEAEKYPHITFTATDIAKDGDDYKMTGDMTVKDVTLPVTFDVEFGGKAKNPWGAEVVAFSAAGKINRKDFGLTWNQALETGGVMVGEDIKLNLELEATQAE